ncbi:parallel beta-helix repeat protein [Colletotrichum orchidophilum]|uniref:Parallel beta-helix repeat protein n=1 Tax=Colletotrichum orchidophilum TaxID=1209926 RepID=A0A1G4BQF3_9PEZI|nr:parallel beta-helix repeat protein [Colletotrichum orchidophilum]OHF03674.1 parallel beta-helix repeat protein [Colletotrichum orchidophilum]
MVKSSILTAVLTLASSAAAECGLGTPDAKVTGSGSAFVATKGSSQVYNGSDYLAAIQAAVDSISSGQRVSIIASGSIGAGTIAIQSGKTFEGCGTINAALRAPRGAIEVTDASGVTIPYLTMTGNPYFALRCFGTKDLTLGTINMDLSGTESIGIRFDRDQAANTNVKMGTVTVTGAGSHAIETWNIDGLTIDQVIAKNCGQCGLLLQKTTNAQVGFVSGTDVGATTGYATLRFANNNGQLPDGSYTPNIFVKNVFSRRGGRGVFCVSESGGAVIDSIDLADNVNNAILIENCYDVTIKGGKVKGGGQVRISARTEFPNTKDISITAEVDDTTVLEDPCGVNITWNLSGNAPRTLCQK